MTNETRGDGSLKLVSATAGGTAGRLKAGRALHELFERFNNGVEKRLRPGMLAQWKPGMSNRTMPGYGEPMIVMALIDPPLVDPCSESGSIYFRERLDLLLGSVDEKIGFVSHHLDARRLEPYLNGFGVDFVANMLFDSAHSLLQADQFLEKPEVWLRDGDELRHHRLDRLPTDVDLERAVLDAAAHLAHQLIPTGDDFIVAFRVDQDHFKVMQRYGDEFDSMIYELPIPAV